MLPFNDSLHDNGYMKKVSAKHFLHPKYWGTWLGLGCLWLLVQLPWSLQMWLGQQTGLLIFHTLKRRRHICDTNLKLAFPQLNKTERTALSRQHFISLGQGLLEAGLSWWGDDTDLAAQTEIKGLEHLHQAIEQGGVILLSAHFTSLELGGRILAQHLPLHVVYRPHQNPLIEWRVSRLRSKRYGKAISRNDIRTMIRSLKDKQVVWYAPDQNFGSKNSVFAPFFGVEAATNTATSRLSQLGKAQVIPFFTVRTKTGYQLSFLPALDNFPSDDTLSDTIRINQVIEQQVQEHPEQYLWTHRRYKDRPDGSNVYQ